jgi:hypothetical protein
MLTGIYLSPGGPEGMRVGADKRCLKSPSVWRITSDNSRSAIVDERV